MSQAGLVNNLNDGVGWGLFPLLFTMRGVSIDCAALLVATYPAVWAAAQLLAGPLSDRIGRRSLMSVGSHPPRLARHRATSPQRSLLCAVGAGRSGCRRFALVH